MKLIETSFRGLVVIEPTVYKDDRGYFMESFSDRWFRSVIGPVNFVQDNESFSSKGVLRGLHFQINPSAQAKLVRVTRGSVLDVAVDLRKSEPTYGKYFAMELSDKNKLQMFIPEGFAHGFLALEDNTLFNYKCSEFYSKEHERSLRWNDPLLKINWGTEDPLVSPKDAEASLFSDFISTFD
jgi:dTDP-4-dehydrorhamnose 3,5-epimerase